jgi:hypothetical protein
MTTRTSGFSPTEPLQNPQVQIATFGRRLAGHPDALPGYALSAIEITDPGVIAASGQARHPIITQ